MSVKVIVSLDVADFRNFKSRFDNGRSAREDAGISESEAYQNMDLPNNVWVIGTATSKEAILEFFASAAQTERMKGAGVISAPTITILEA
jgi:hypothetical protein